MPQHALRGGEVMQDVAEQFTVPLERTGIAGRQLGGAAEFALGAVEIIRILQLRPTARVSLAEIGCEYERALDVLTDMRLLGGGNARVFLDQFVGIGRGNVGARIVAVDRDGLLEVRS